MIYYYIWITKLYFSSNLCYIWIVLNKNKKLERLFFQVLDGRGGWKSITVMFDISELYMLMYTENYTKYTRK